LLLKMPGCLWPLVRTYLGEDQLAGLALACQRLSALCRRPSFWQGFKPPVLGLYRSEDRRILTAFRGACLAARTEISVMCTCDDSEASAALLCDFRVHSLLCSGHEVWGSYPGLASLLSVVACVHKLRIEHVSAEVDVASALRCLQAPAAMSELTLASVAPVADDTLAAVAQFRSLVHLSLDCCGRLTAAGLRHLRALAQLRKLHLESCTLVADDALSFLPALGELRVLALGYEGRAAAGNLRHISLCRKLRQLRISSSGVAYDELLQICEASSLRSLFLVRCLAVPVETIERLRRTKPNISFFVTDEYLGF